MHIFEVLFGYVDVFMCCFLCWCCCVDTRCNCKWVL